MSIINLLTLLVLIVYVTIWRHYLTGVIVVAILSVIEVFTYGMKHAMYLFACELMLVLFIIKETKEKKDASPFVRYNPMDKRNVLPAKLRIIILMFFLLALVIRLIDVLFPVLRK